MTFEIQVSEYVEKTRSLVTVHDDFNPCDLHIHSPPFDHNQKMRTVSDDTVSKFTNGKTNRSTKQSLVART